MTAHDSSVRSGAPTAATRPSPGLLAAALAGFGLTAAASCTAEATADPDPCPDLSESSGTNATTMPATTTTGAPGETSSSASAEGPGSTSDATSTGPVDPTTTTDDTAGTETGDTGEPIGCEPPVVLSETETKQTFAQYTEDCEELGGYVQITPACAGVNSCAGFSVGDWNPDVRSEHTCRGLNGCNGLSCITTPPDGGLTGEQVLHLEAIPNGQPDDVINGPAPCGYCHSVYVDDKLDLGAFKVHVFPGSGRTADNWLDRSAAQMEHMVAFGAHGVTSEGIAYSAMVGYAKSLSRAEIERVVAHIRTLEPVIQEIKVVEP